MTTEDQDSEPKAGEGSWFARSLDNDHRLAKRNSWRRHPKKMLKQRLRPTKTPEPIADPATTNAEFLARLKELPIGYWTYGWEEPEIRHLGPMAQDFWNAFGLGTTDRKINLVDGQGVLIAPIQALLDRVEELERQVAQLESRAATDD